MRRCPHCQQPMPEPVKRARTCFDCNRPIRAHDKWRWDYRGGVLTCVHRHCDNPRSYEPKGFAAAPASPLFGGKE